MPRSAFTRIELFIVIAIIAIFLGGDSKGWRIYANSTPGTTLGNFRHYS